MGNQGGESEATEEETHVLGGKRKSLVLECVDISKLMHKHTELSFLLLIFYVFFVGFYIEIFLKMVKYKSLFRNYQKTFNDLSCSVARPVWLSG